MKKLSFKNVSTAVSKVIHSSAFKHSLILGGLILVANTAYAGGEAGTAGIEAAAASFKQYQGSVSNLCKAIAAVIAVVGAFNIYFKMRAFVPAI